MTKQTQTMALVTTNNNRAMTRAARRALPALGALAVSKNGREMIWDGLQYVATKGMQLAKGYKNRSRGRKGDIVLHPGASAGAVAAPVAISRVVRGSRPKFSKSKGSVTITHRELVGQFNNSIGLVVNGGVAGNLYRVNPSNPLLFPWLQSMSANFDLYKFDSLRLQFVPMCATTETGRVAIYFDKDSQDPEPADRVELANMQHLTETAPWCESSLSLPVDNVRRFTTDSATTDLKLVDLGQVGIATYGGSGANVVGDLFIHYTVTLFEPQPTAGLISTAQTGAGSANFGANLVSVLSTTTTTTLTFRTPGIFIIAMVQRALTFTGVTPIGVTFNSNTNTTATGTNYAAIYNVTVPVPGAQMQFVGTGFGNFTLHTTRARTANVATLL